MNHQGTSQSIPRTSSSGDQYRSQNETKPKQYNFWTFQKCNNKACSHRLNHINHLIIHEKVRDAKTINHHPRPFAISYAWGILPHKKYFLGHDPELKPYHIKLGPEWDREKFLERLLHHSRSLSNDDPSGLRLGWLDQISNRKGDRGWTLPKWPLERTRKSEDEIDTDDVDPEALNQIPEIFRRCEVVVLFPGSHCRCLYGNTAADSENSACINYINLLTWWTRLWPRQEFVYANKVKIDWINGGGFRECLRSEDISKAELNKMAYLCERQYKELFWLQARTRGRPCQSQACQSFLKWQLRFKLEVKLISKARNIQPLEVANEDDVVLTIKNLFRKIKTREEPDEEEPNQKELCPCKITLEDFKTYQQAHFDTMSLALKEKQADNADSVTLDEFLSGTPIQTKEWVHQPHLNTSQEYERFWFHLGIVSRSKREVTQPEDLVRAVWPECPGWRYKKPKQKKGCEAFLEPLKDGLEHLNKNGWALITMAPYGLFEKHGSCTSWEWQPDTYMAKKGSDEGSDAGSGKGSGEGPTEFPGITSHAYGTMASPFVPVPIKHGDGPDFLALEYHDHHLARRSLLANSQLFEEKFPMKETTSETTSEETTSEEATPEETKSEETTWEDIKKFVSSVALHWPEPIRNRCRGPRRVILEMVLKKMNTFVTGNALPKVATDVTADMTAWGLYTTRLMLRHRAHLIILLTLVGQDQKQLEGSNFYKVLRVIQAVFPRQVQDWALDKAKNQREKQHGKLYMNQAMQALRDQWFHDTAIWSETDVGILDHSRLDRSRETRVNHIDTVYYMVAEALGFRPGDLGLDYNKSFPEGKAYKGAQPLLVTSESAGHSMLGLMSRSCFEQTGEGWTRRNGRFMTIAFRDGNTATDPTQKTETCLYEAEMQTDQSGPGGEKWRIVGVWVPVTSPRVMEMVSGWFEPGAREDGRLL